MKHFIKIFQSQHPDLIEENVSDFLHNHFDAREVQFHFSSATNAELGVVTFSVCITGIVEDEVIT